jgi:pimeloyl-ACP methyl ester carboxylesterase
VPLSPLYDGGQPSPVGLYERCCVLYWLYYGQSEDLAAFWSSIGGLEQAVNFVGPPTYAASFQAGICGGQLAIAILGTQTAEQMLGHVVGASTPASTFAGGFQNSWFGATAQQMVGQLGHLLGSNPAPSSVEIWGHSYGGGVAGLLAYEIRGAFPSLVVNVATFGSPRARGGPAPHPSPASWVRVRNQLDPISVIPPRTSSVVSGILTGPYSWAISAPAPWIHDGQGVLLNDQGGFTTAYSDANQDNQTWQTLSSTTQSDHFIGHYRANLKANPEVVNPPPATLAPPVANPAALVAGVTSPPSGPATPALVADANQLYYGSTDGPLTSQNYGSLQLSAAVVSSAQVTPRTNIANFGGSRSMPAAPSNYTKVTMCINNGIYGRTESHVLNLAYNSPLVLPAVQSLCTYRAACLGCAFTTGQTPSKGLGTPQIEWVRLTDAVNPKAGVLFDARPSNYFGYVTASGIPSDTAFNALSIRMVGQMAANFQTGGATPSGFANSTLQLTEAPDDAIQQGAFVPTFKVATNATILSNIQAYIQTLLSSSLGTWGFIGFASNQPKTAITGWAYTAGAWVLSFSGTPFNAGDRVAITHASPVFNKIWTLNVSGTGVVSLVNGPVAGHTVPTGGYAQRVAVAGGISAKAFYSYYTAQGTVGGAPFVRVSKKNPGRQFLGVSFRSRRRRER